MIRVGVDVGGTFTDLALGQVEPGGRHKRPHNFSLQFDVLWQGAPLIKRRNRIVVDERVLPPDGRVETRLAGDQVERGLDAVVIGFLFSFLNNDHELRAAEIVRRVMPDAFVCASSGVVNAIREYERFSTVAMNAYTGPRTRRHLDNLRLRLSHGPCRSHRPLP